VARVVEAYEGKAFFCSLIARPTILIVDRKRKASNKSAIAIVASESLPQVEAHVDGVVDAHVSIRNNGRLRDTVVLHGDFFATKGVML
jgi:hypothetical protein